jgi:hypothetical protein
MQYHEAGFWEQRGVLLPPELDELIPQDRRILELQHLCRLFHLFLEAGDLILAFPGRQLHAALRRGL